jgi:hypothetical protein
MTIRWRVVAFWVVLFWVWWAGARWVEILSAH